VVRNLFVVLFLFLIAGGGLYNQSAYTLAGKSALGAFIGFSSNKDASTFLGAGLSLLGRVNLSFGYSTISFEEPFYGEDLSASVVTFSVSFFT
ncbi:MAG: hypothetical protein N2442_01800, partial [Spirochaetes bacterium]|nr:hypothetical protein [Spirochaetota bacterium]